MTGTEVTNTIPRDGEHTQIVVLRQGWVFVGKVLSIPGGILMPNANCVRKWGTTRGLGEIAHGGPTPATVLDRMGYLGAPSASLLFTLGCSQEAWASVLGEPA